MTEEERKKYRKMLERVLRRNPKCIWARNELKYFDMKPLPCGSVVLSGGALKADSDYHGGYVE